MRELVEAKNLRLGLMIIVGTSVLFWGSCFAIIHLSLAEYKERRDYFVVCQTLVEHGLPSTVEECAKLFLEAPNDQNLNRVGNGSNIHCCSGSDYGRPTDGTPERMDRRVPGDGALIGAATGLYLGGGSIHQDDA